MSRFGEYQVFRLPPDRRDWVPEDDPAHLVNETVERDRDRAFKLG